MKMIKINIIGGLGRMGRLMAGLFGRENHELAVFDSLNGPFSWAEAADGDVVLICVPIPDVAETVKAIGPYTRPGGLVMDITSLKESPVRAMLEHCRGEVIGGHPLFGPQAKTADGHIFFICPARAEQWLPWVHGVLAGQNLKVIEIEPGSHDRLMSRIQVLRHMFLISFGRTLMRLGFDVEAETALSGPWFNDLMGHLNRMVDQGPDLFADLALMNPESEAVFQEFGRAAGEVAGSFGSGDRDQIIGLIENVSHYIKNGEMRPGA